MNSIKLKTKYINYGFIRTKKKKLFPDNKKHPLFSLQNKKPTPIYFFFHNLTSNNKFSYRHFFKHLNTNYNLTKIEQIIGVPVTVRKTKTKKLKKLN